MRWLIHLAAVWLLATYSAQSRAAELIVTNGKLVGATGVLVNGSSYNVSFVDGTCAALFNGCDQTADFFFQTPADAQAASQALMDQVFLGAYDTTPGLTSGCATTAASCSVITPYAYVNSTTVSTYRAWNFATETSDTRGSTNVSPSLNTGASTAVTYAVWSIASAAPEPSTWLMMILGFGTVGHSLRRRQRSAAPLALA
jgi:hypothetical protein